MRNIILMMAVSADGHTLITGTPAGRPCGHPGTGRADFGRGRPAHQKNAQRSAALRSRPGLAAEPSPRGGRHRAMSIGIITLSDGENQGERARSRRYGRQSQLAD
jgi:hypothetical protein